MVWPSANNQLDYNTVSDIQKYYLDGSNIHIVLIIPLDRLYQLVFSGISMEREFT